MWHLPAQVGSVWRSAVCGAWWTDVLPMAPGRPVVALIKQPDSRTQRPTALAAPWAAGVSSGEEAEPREPGHVGRVSTGGTGGGRHGCWGWFAPLFSSHPQGMRWRRAWVGLVPFSCHLLLFAFELQSWLAHARP